MSIKFTTNPEGIRITTYQPQNIKFEFNGKFYRVEIYIEEPAENTKAKNDKEKKYKPEEKEITFIKTKPIDLELLAPLDTRRKLTKVRHTDGYIPPEKNGSFIIRYCAFSIEEEEKQLKYSNQSGY
ncbi:hypothetical protein SFV10_004651 [Salmonella enterica subsp. enterica serovar Kentucky]|nr:hypothetical protein [Salmonella enterica subsp. enterica serovar Anatum]EHC3605303.1 hypothetical protein [Salmonella enterica subsp. enterica serovar Kentucky]